MVGGGVVIERLLEPMLQPEYAWHRDPFALARPEDDPLTVRPDRIVELPYLFRDGDLVVDLEMGAGTGLDVLLRRVEPRQDEAGVVAQFHGRFAVLRLSAQTGRPSDGNPFRSREQALFEGEDPFALDGPALPMDGGYRATLEVQLRGRLLRGRVAGRPWSDWFEATDDYGSFAFFARRGRTIVHGLQFTPQPIPDPGLAWRGALLGVAGWLLLMVLGGGFAGAVALALVAPVGAWGLGLWLRAHLEPLTRTEPEAFLWLGAASVVALLPFALALTRVRKLWWLPVGALLAAGAIERTLRLEAPRLSVAQDPRLDLYFGPDSGAAPAEALAQRVRPMWGGIHLAGESRRRVLALGGSPIWEAAPDAAHSLAPLLLGQLRATVAGDLDVVAPVGWPGDALQHVRRFGRFLRGFGCEAVLLALHPWELDPIAGGRVRARFDAAAKAPVDAPALWLMRVLGSAPAEGPAATAEDLALAMDEAAALCAARGVPLVLVAVPELPDPIRQAMREAVGRLGATLVELSSPEAPVQAATLASALAELLRRD